MTDAVRRQANRVFVAVVSFMLVVWLVLLVDLVTQGRWLDVVLLVVITALVVIAYRTQRAHRPYTG